MSASRVLPPWVLLLLAGAAAALLLSALQVGFLSDDWLIVHYLDRDTGAVHWDRVLFEFTRPWFGVRDLYRPMVSLSFGAQAAAHGMSSAWFHAANVAMLLVAALAIAALVHLRLPALRGAFAAGAGLVLLVHPAVVEPSHWIAARTTGLEVMFSALAMWAYAAFLFGRLRSRWPAFVLMALALGSKEGALMLAVSLAAVDLLCTRGSLQARVQGLRPFWVLLVAYLLFRKVTLGWFTTAKEGLEPLALVQQLLRHAGQLAVPPGDALRWLAVPALLVLLAPLARQRPARSLGYLAWVLLLLVPASHVAPIGQAFDGRLVYPCLPAIALWLGEAAAAHRRPLVPLCAGALLAVAWGAQTVPLAAQYRAGGAQVAAFRDQLRTAAADAAPGRPLAPVAFAHPDVHLLLLQESLWGLLLLRPFAPRDAAVAGLPGVLPRFGASDAAACDAAPALAVLDAGGRLAEQTQGVLRLHAAPEPHELPQLRAVGGGRFAASAPWHPLQATVVEVEVPAPARRCTLKLAVELPALTAFGERTVDAAAAPVRTFWFDLGSSATGLVLHGLGQPWPDFVVAVDGAPAPDGTRLVLHRRPAPLDAPRLQGREVRVEELADVFVPPVAGAELHVLLPTTAAVLHVRDGRLALDGAGGGARDGAEAIRFARAILGHCLVHCCWRTGDGILPPQRSALDWFVLR